MPTFIKIFSYKIYFWSAEGEPLEPVHFHIAEGKPRENATKYWINSDGSLKQENNNSHIPQKVLSKMEKTLLEYAFDIVKAWEEYFGEPAKFHDQQGKKEKRITKKQLNPLNLTRQIIKRR